MERVLYNLHAKVCSQALRRTSSKGRRWLEYLILLGGVCGFSVLFVLHVSFVHSGGRGGIPVECLASIPNFDVDADVTRVYLLLNHSSHDKEAVSLDNSFAVTLNSTTCSMNFNDTASIIHQVSFSKTKGYLLLPDEVLQQHNISTQIVGVSTSNRHCFGEPFLETMVHYILGYDTVVINWLSSLGTGFLYHPKTDILQPMSKTHHLSLWRTPQWSIVGQKLGVVLTSIVLFFITTTLTSFILRETQQRMLEFTIQLQHHVREGWSLKRLIIMHIVENLVFCPIMIGMFFFLMEFYDGDKVLAFLVLSLVWICEVFSVVSLRSRQGVEYFPRIFFLLFTVFHVYAFSCPHGFTYTALACTVAFLLHSMLFFWNRYELPAIAHGLVTVQHPRMVVSSSPERRVLASSPERSRMIDVPPTTPQPSQVHSLPQRTSTSTLGADEGTMSRPASYTALFQQNDGGEDDSCLYLLSGEVVMHNRATLTSQNEPQTEDPPLPLEVDLTPRMGSTAFRQNNEDDDNNEVNPRALTAPAFPLHLD